MPLNVGVLSAVVVVFLLDFAVRQATGAAPSDYRLIRLGSYALIVAIGALIVMLFGLANDLVVPAVMMVVAISAGMALAMSAIGVAAILGRNWTEARVAATPERRLRFEAGARIAGAACVLVIGATLFAVTFMQTPAGEGRQQATIASPLQKVSKAIAN